MHLIEFAENSADFQHFQPLHGRMEIPYLGIPIPLLSIQQRRSLSRFPSIFGVIAVPSFLSISSVFSIFSIFSFSSFSSFFFYCAKGISHTADWKVEEDKTNSHIAFFYDKAQLCFRGKPVPRSGADASIPFSLLPHPSSIPPSSSPLYLSLDLAPHSHIFLLIFLLFLSFPLSSLYSFLLAPRSPFLLSSFFFFF